MHFQVTVTPPRTIETALQVICGMARTGRLNRECLPQNPFDLAYLARLFESYLPGVPIEMQRIALASLITMGAVLGYVPDVAVYCHAATGSATSTRRTV